MVFGQDGHFHPHKCIIVMQVDDVFIQQTDATFAAPADFQGLPVVGTAMDSDAGMAGSLQTQEPVSIGGNRAPTVAEIMMPIGGILDLADLERRARIGFGRLVVSPDLLLAPVLGDASRIGGQ